MAAKQIPNLLDKLRSSQRPRGGRSRGHHMSSGSTDEIIRGTDSDAAGSRLSAVEQGYLDDPFARAFAQSQEIVRRMPIINRGTYVRTKAVDTLIQTFLDIHKDSSAKQIVSLGAGTDTRFFRLIHKQPNLLPSLRYHEIDFPEMTAKKIAAIEQAPFVTSLLKSTTNESSSCQNDKLEISSNRTCLSSPCYSIHGMDLRNFADSDLDSEHPNTISGWIPSAPTLVLSECCLTYIPEATSSKVLNRFVETLIPQPAYLCIVLYEPLHPDDSFGKTMTLNLAARGIEMPSLHAIPTLEFHTERLAEKGFLGGQRGLAIKQIWETWVDEEEKERLKGLEMVDEEEEWMLLAAHYGIVWAERGSSTDFTTSSHRIV